MVAARGQRRQRVDGGQYSQRLVDATVHHLQQLDGELTSGGRCLSSDSAHVKSSGTSDSTRRRIALDVDDGRRVRPRSRPSG